jgi:predicted Fe-Mo cluster-binding NifX family protein
MRIAVSSQNFRSITSHAGKSRRFLVYELTPRQEPVEVERVDLPKGMSLHDYHADDHPLFGLGLDAIVTGGAGSGFIQRMSRQGIQVLATSETEIVAALSAIAAGEPLPAAAPHDHNHDHGHDQDQDCDHSHGHGHGHDHGHGHGQAH